MREGVKLPDEVQEGEYDADYYIHNQVVPAVDKIFEVLGYSRENLVAPKDQKKLDAWFV